MAPLAASNPRIRRLRRLSGRRSARHDDGAFVLEGPVLVAEALAALVPLDGIYAEASALEPELVATAHAQGVPVHEVAEGVLDGVTDTVTPRPILAVAPLVQLPAADVVARAVDAGRPLLVLVDPHRQVGERAVVRQHHVLAAQRAPLALLVARVVHREQGLVDW